MLFMLYLFLSFQIVHINNPTLFDQFKCVKEEVTARNLSKSSEQSLERYLWHGTSVRKTSSGLQPIANINTKSFNRSYAGLLNGK